MPQTEAPILRVPRPSDDLDAVLKFYEIGLAFDLLYRFEDHDGFDGIMLGHRAWPYHFEFTRKHGHRAGRALTADHLLVFYLPEELDWLNAIERLQAAGFQPVSSFNPYCDRLGKTFEDPDGYRIVVQNGSRGL